MTIACALMAVVKIGAKRRAERLRQKRRCNIADHDWPDVCRVASLEAAADHAQHAPKRRRVPFCADQIIVQHNKKAVDGKFRIAVPAPYFAVIHADAVSFKSAPYCLKLPPSSSPSTSASAKAAKQNRFATVQFPSPAPTPAPSGKAFRPAPDRAPRAGKRPEVLSEPQQSRDHTPCNLPGLCVRPAGRTRPMTKQTASVRTAPKNAPCASAPG